jgi:hypothetical protein
MRYVDGERDPENVAWATAASSSIVADALGADYPLRAWWWRRSATDYTKFSDDLDRISEAFDAKDAVAATSKMRTWLDKNNLWDAAELASNWRVAVNQADRTAQDLNDTLTRLVSDVMPQKVVDWAYGELRDQLRRQTRDAEAKKTVFFDYIAKMQEQAAPAPAPSSVRPKTAPSSALQPNQPTKMRPAVTYGQKMPNALKWTLLAAGVYGMYRLIARHRRS